MPKGFYMPGQPGVSGKGFYKPGNLDDGGEEHLSEHAAAKVECSTAHHADTDRDAFEKPMPHTSKEGYAPAPSDAGSESRFDAGYASTDPIGEPVHAAPRRDTATVQKAQRKAKLIVAVIAAICVCAIAVVWISGFLPDSGVSTTTVGSSASSPAAVSLQQPADERMDYTGNDLAAASSDNAQGDSQDYGTAFTDNAAKFAFNTNTEVVGQISDSAYFVIRDYATDLYGIFCADTFAYSVEPTFGNIVISDDPNYIPAEQNGSYGFIDCYGNTVIDFYYDAAKPFCNGYAPAKMDGAGWGVIDQSGNVKIDFTFYDIDLTEDWILCCTGVNLNGDHFYCLYNYDFNCVVSEDPLDLKDYYGNFGYVSFEFIGDYVFAKRFLSDVSDEFEAYDVFYAIGTDEPVLTKDYISQITNLRFSEWYCRILREDRFAIAIYDHSMTGDGRSYFITDGNFNVICSTPFAYIGKPYSHDKLLVNTTEKCSDYLYLNKKAWYIADMNGNILRSLPALDEAVIPNGQLYVSLNDDYAYARGYYNEPIYILYNYNTDTWFEMAGPVQMLPDTQCILVTSKDSGLYGIIDHGEQVRDCLYSDAELKDGVIILTRGAQQETYTPQ